MAITRIGTDQNLGEGETYEILQMSFSEGYPVGAVTFEFGKTPRKITGIQKVVQTLLKILLTSKGSDVVYPSFGTSFPDLAINSNTFMDDADFHSEISNAVKDAVNQTKELLNSPYVDPASKLRSAELRGLFMQDNTLNLAIRIITEAGEQGNIAMPFPETDITKNPAA